MPHHVGKADGAADAQRFDPVGENRVVPESICYLAPSFGVEVARVHAGLDPKHRRRDQRDDYVLGAGHGHAEPADAFRSQAGSDAARLPEALRVGQRPARGDDHRTIGFSGGHPRDELAEHQS